MRKYRPKKNSNLVGQTPNPVAPCPVSDNLDGSVLLALLPETHFSLLSWFCSMSEGLLGSCPSNLSLGISNAIQASLPQHHTMASSVSLAF